MSEVVIKVENLWKQYRYGVLSHRTLHKDLQSWWARLRGKEDPNSRIGHPASSIQHPVSSNGDDRFYALQDINFEVKQSEVLGIIGRNGAGKSTLLKILSRVTTPTKGQIKIRGRVASLLEVGTGFHPELTGRENIFLNGAILGMTKEEIKKKFDEIVAFAEVEKFIDTPVKRYSSGMYVRLAFAVAAHLEPEILLVDEVLAVGDAAFQKKCMGKMGDISKEGRTVLFVSHNMQAIQNLCAKTILLENGSVIDRGESSTVITNYLNKAIQNKLEQNWNDMNKAPGNEYIRIKSIKVIPEFTNGDNKITVETPIAIKFEFWNLVPNIFINLSLVLWKVSGECVFNYGTKSLELQKGIYSSTCFIPGNLLNDDTYSVEIYFVKDSSIVLFKESEIAFFKVHDVERFGWYGKWIGAVRPKLVFSLEKCG
jgi:lipopolysaccharide transport system ATP-binding protein